MKESLQNSRIWDFISTRRKNRQGKNSTIVSVIIALVVLCAFWSLVTPYFLTVTNFKNIVQFVAANGVMAAGLTVTLLTGCMDLSQMPLMALCGMVVGMLSQNGISGIALFLIAMGTGAIGGVLNSVNVTILKIAPFIATLGSQLLFRSIAFMTTDGVYLTVKDEMIRQISKGSFLGLPIILWIMAVVYVGFWFLLKYTHYGRNVYTSGGNPVAAYLSGISVTKIRFIAYMVSGACCGLASILYITQSNVALNNAGTGAEMDIMAAVILGGISLGGGSGSVINTLLGVIMLGVIANGMSLLGIPPYFQILIKGLLLLAAVVLDSFRNRSK